MKKGLTLFFVVAISMICLASGYAQEAPKEQTYRAWWHEYYFSRPFKSELAKKLPLITIQGNKFVTEKGDTILFRGLAISDPDKIANQGHWDKKLFEEVQKTGANLVRIPIHPVAWRERKSVEYLKLIDQAVEWCSDLNMYIIIDWHTIGNLKAEMFQDPMYDTTQKETFDFWRSISRRYIGNNTIAFYELFNEPTNYNGQLGAVTWEEWRKLNEDMICIIRAFDQQVIPIVSGFDWAYDLTPLRIDPIKAERIAYSTHPYAHKRTQPWEPKWEEDFGFAADRYPIIATEFGFGLRPGTELKTDDYAYKIVDFLESRGISWVCWVYDPEWGPSMLQSWDGFKLTAPGEFFKKAMHGEIQKKSK